MVNIGATVEEAVGTLLYSVAGFLQTTETDDSPTRAKLTELVKEYQE